MEDAFLDTWTRLSTADRADIFTETARQQGLPASVVEKDWWVSLSLRVVFNMDVGRHLVFKGGTSLSKGWGLIDRFSEDIDLAIDREFLGFTGELGRKQLNRLRKASQSYVVSDFVPQLMSAFSQSDIEPTAVRAVPPKVSDEDPVRVELHYPAVAGIHDYVLPRVLLELGCRSLREPFTLRPVRSMVGDTFPDREFADSAVDIPCTLPKRTFLEKVFLMHEVLQRHPDAPTERYSRHLYDLMRMTDDGVADEALEDEELYRGTVRHRSIFNRVGGVDYAQHSPETIRIVPFEQYEAVWARDYQAMRESMIRGESPSFSELMKRITALQGRINVLGFGL